MKYLVIVTIMLSVSGCAIRQVEFHTSTENIRISPASKTLVVYIRSETKDPEKKPILNVGKSYALSPNKELLQLKLTTTEKPSSYETFWKEYNLTLIDSNGNPKKWKNGEWEIQLNFEEPHYPDGINSKFRFWTLLYCPVIHGPPNGS